MNNLARFLWCNGGGLDAFRGRRGIFPEVQRWNEEHNLSLWFVSKEVEISGRSAGSGPPGWLLMTEPGDPRAKKGNFEKPKIWPKAITEHPNQ